MVKNVIAADFTKNRKNALLIYVDLMDVQYFQSMARRVQHGISKSLTERFPAKTALTNLAKFFKQLTLVVEIDPVSGSPSFNISLNSKDDQKNLMALMESIEKLAKKYSLMLVLDEFQDITFVSEAEAAFRQFLQTLGRSTVFILGSKQHLLDKMFGNNQSPLFQYGDEIHLQPIPLESWLPYFRERLQPRGIQIGKEEMQTIMEIMCNVPNAICELGSWLMEYYPNKTLSIQTIHEALNQMVETRQSYAYRVQALTKNEKKILTCVAKLGFLLEPQSMDFVQSASVSKSSIGKTVEKLMNLGILEYELDRGYRLSDPILGHYLATR